MAQWTATQFDPSMNWSDLEWIRDIWPGKIILKGITDPEDARIAAGTGASAIVVSNHGGRQLDGAPPAITALAPIADAVGSEVELIFDSGIRSGQDVLRALSLGARSCMIGRAYIYGLGAGGQAGVTRAIEIIRKELDTSMALTGCTSVSEAGPTSSPPPARLGPPTKRPLADQEPARPVRCGLAEPSFGWRRCFALLRSCPSPVRSRSALHRAKP